MIVIQVLIITIAVYLFTYMVKCYKYRRILNKIPSPPGHWLLGNMDILLKHNTDELFDFLRQCAKKHWPIYRFSSPYTVAINLLHPADLEIVLSQMKHLSKSKIYEFLEAWLGEGLLTSSGAKWQSRRKILTRAFHFSILQQFLKVFCEETQNLVNQIDKKCQNSESINILPLVTHMTLQSIGETAMGIKNIDEHILETYRKSIYKMGKLLFRRITSPWIRHPLVYVFTKTYRDEKATINFLHSFTKKIIEEREKQILKQKDQNLHTVSYSGRKIMRMLDLLLQAKINDNSIDLEGIREEVDTFMFEGHDTTSIAICFLLYSLAQNRNIQDEVRKEIREVIGSKLNPTYNDLQELNFTERVIKETLRLYPSVPFISRIASEDFVTHTGYSIPKGSILHMHIFDLHRNPKIYPDPLKFDPNRFLAENSIDRHPFAYLPFSAGPRNCIGQKFAMLELKSVLCGILRTFQLDEDRSTNIVFFPDLVLRTKSEIMVKFTTL